jgi:putative ABC transport system permease protein
VRRLASTILPVIYLHEENRGTGSMTFAQFVTKNAFRNRRRSVLTALSISFSLLLLCIMMAVWRGFYIDQGAPDSALRLMTRHRVSLAFFLPGYYRDKIRAVPGVVHVVPMTWFGGRYKDDRPENFFAQFATDPSEYMEVAADKIVPEDQVKAWQQDRTGCMVDQALAAKHGWKIGDRIVLLGTIFPANLNSPYAPSIPSTRPTIPSISTQSILRSRLAGSRTLPGSTSPV